MTKRYIPTAWDSKDTNRTDLTVILDDGTEILVEIDPVQLYQDALENCLPNQIMQLTVLGRADWQDQVPSTFGSRCESLIKTAFEELFDEGIIEISEVS